MDKLIRYKDLLDRTEPSNPSYNLIKICVCRYEINTIKYNINHETKYLIIMNAIEKILDQFIDIEFVG